MAKRNNVTASPAISDPAIVGLEELLGQSVAIYCGVYIYSGKLIAIGPAAVKLAGASIVYETGVLTSKEWSDAQELPGPHWWVSLGAIESFGPGKES
jgi:hypothetical protein